MKIKSFPFLILISGILLFSGCHKQNKEFQKEIAELVDAKCRIMECSKLIQDAKSVVPIDSLAIQELQMKKKNAEIDMTILNREFNEKYAKVEKDPKFLKEFGNEMKKAMLNCKYLPKEYREKFEKETE